VGQLALVITNWQVITKDRWVLDSVKGYKPELVAHLWQVKTCSESTCNSSRAIPKGKGQSPPICTLCLVHLVSFKEDGGQRAVIILNNVVFILEHPTLDTCSSPQELGY
jgi:hypothetical protein